MTKASTSNAKTSESTQQNEVTNTETNAQVTNSQDLTDGAQHEETHSNVVSSTPLKDGSEKVLLESPRSEEVSNRTRPDSISESQVSDKADTIDHMADMSFDDEFGMFHFVCLLSMYCI